MTRITVIPGDGIGPEVTEQALLVLGAFDLGLEFDVLDHVNAGTFLETGVALSEVDLERIAGSAGTLLGAVGDPRVAGTRYARDVLLRLRFELDLYVNYRPVRLLDARLSPLRRAGRREIDCAIVRENTEGLYTDIGGALRSRTEDEVAIDTEVTTHLGVRRVIDYAMAAASRAVCMVDKSNAVPNGGRVWQRLWRAACAERPDLETTHLYVDVAAMRLVQDPTRFEVIVTNNSYGDILSDLAAELAGGLGTAASVNLNPGTGFGLYEPVHGSAPDIAGTDTANPIGAVLSAALLLDRVGYRDEATAVRAATDRAVADGRCTADIGGSLGTRAAGEAIRDLLA
ncbi:isocitrate/isopropylmalate dehydrogenase family protein [Actinoplanes couchii]|uniref:3-isopropylmalate dehydrogenase n=1 Tax=Actinoplanes couchii TaxID=403638 RepID=A0ABQ3XSI1_9ACTN|nr:isocitrate/isopropylmalate family dehydrogenase [Actinoplanes couchii]MDR6315961.1 3-isopropylmalate dehydrogenase [Actinoplanes couchii]GID61479.1 3-isopropylmalate dehydrogenase [Actinoplanes couchii]